jgi:SAM-dependent methyltransferase
VASVDAPDRLYPHLGQLFANMPTLGASPSLIMRRLRGLGFALPGRGEPLRAIDLGCGPGGVAVALAKTLRMEVVGIDGCPAFIDSARELATAEGVSDRCAFVATSLESFTRSRALHRDYDVALMLNVWPAMRAARATRAFVRIGGVYVIDDAVRDPACDDRAWRSVPTLEHVSERIAQLGDEVLDARVLARPAMARVEAALQKQLAINARRLARREPVLADTLREFVRGQQEAAGLLEGPLRGAMWIVRRGA